MPAAIIIGAGIAAGASIYGANRQANASRDAARTQSQSADRAMDVQRDIYNQQRQMVDPYLQAGLASLGSMVQQYGNAGRPMPAGYQFNPQPQMGSLAGSFGARAGQQGPRPVGSGMTAAAAAIPGAVSLGSIGKPAIGGGTVKLQAPTGEVMDVSEQDAPHFISRGAVRLS